MRLCKYNISKASCIAGPTVNYVFNLWFLLYTLRNNISLQAHYRLPRFVAKNVYVIARGTSCSRNERRGFAKICRFGIYSGFQRTQITTHIADSDVDLAQKLIFGVSLKTISTPRSVYTGTSIRKRFGSTPCPAPFYFSSRQAF